MAKILTNIEEVKDFINAQYEDDKLITMLIEVAEMYLYNATGIEYDSSNKAAVLYCEVLVSDLYDNRVLMDSNKTTVSDKVRFTLQSILLQLKLGGE
ncbi:head-tail connector protein [Clostridium botulinum]|uniref:head-tail connector protein n=1 Tax=Clostridium botulinum TaxID=1491 RepID=UPI000AFD2F28|nr:head-tail connector protein [Clostridium botulinum]